MRKRVIAGNWKMFKTVHDTVRHIKELRPLLKDVRGVEVIVAPPFPAIYPAAEAARGSDIEIAAQNLHQEREGAFTGEVSAVMLRDAGAEYVIIGHSERRTLFGETDLSVNGKLIAALGAGLGSIVCIGETLDQRETNQTFAVLDRQLQTGFESLTETQFAECMLAYEPVWAIGTGRNATPEQAAEAHAHIRSRLRQRFGADAAERCRILYGGSVKPDNIGSLISRADVDGALVGGASLDPRAFSEIVHIAQKT